MIFLNFSLGISVTDCWCNMVEYVCFKYERSFDSLWCVCVCVCVCVLYHDFGPI